MVNGDFTFRFLKVTIKKVFPETFRRKLFVYF